MGCANSKVYVYSMFPDINIKIASHVKNLKNIIENKIKLNVLFYSYPSKGLNHIKEKK